MKVVIISDIHDNIVNLKKCLLWCKDNKIETLICCGDITSDDTLKVIVRGFKRIIHIVGGNVILFKEDEIFKYENVYYYGEFGRFRVDDKRVGLCHEIYFIGKVMELGKCDIIFYGHTHKPWQSKKLDTILLNPGTLGGMFNRSTFAVWDTEITNLELKILDLL
jgi:putative phosphoesterase